MNYGVIVREGLAVNEFCYHAYPDQSRKIFFGAHDAAFANMKGLEAFGIIGSYRVVPISKSMCKRLQKNPNAKYIEGE